MYQSCLTLLLLLLLLLWLIDTSAFAQATPKQLQEQASRCRKLLDSSVTRFYLPNCVDTQTGGYHENWANGKFFSNGEKFLTQQARTLWFFSTLAREGIEKEAALAAAKAGFDFLQTKFLDTVHGGYYSKVKDSGEASDARKHAYLNSFALYALSNYYLASKDAAALNAAQKLFQILESQSYDQKYGGYVEFFYRDWKPITDPKEPMYVGPVGTKTYNTHLHLLESYAELYRAWPDAGVKQRLAELVLINTVTVRHPNHFCNIDQWQRDWQIVKTNNNLRTSYGHDVECAWLVLDALRTIKQPTTSLHSWAQQLVDHSLKFGYDHQHGGFFMAGKLGLPADDTKKEWWVQAEALVGLLELYRITREPKYMKAFQQTLDFVEKHQLAPGGGWYATLDAEGNVKNNTRSNMWQGPYHTGRALLRSAQVLEELGSSK